MASGEEIIDKHIPEGSASIIFNLSGNVNLMYQSAYYCMPKVFITVPHMRYVEIVTNPVAETFIAICKVSVLSKIFSLDLSEMQFPSYINVEKIIPESLWERMRDAVDNENRIRLFEEFIFSHSLKHNYKPDVIDAAYDYIYTYGGKLHIDELADMLKINIRSLRRLFKKRVGLSPKALSRIIRINHVWHSLKKGIPVDFQELVYLGGYTDQAHFIHDFKEITGESPAAFLNRDLHNVKLLSGFDASPF